MDISDDEKREMFVRAKDYSDPPKEANREAALEPVPPCGVVRGVTVHVTQRCDANDDAASRATQLSMDFARGDVSAVLGSAEQRAPRHTPPAPGAFRTPEHRGGAMAGSGDLVAVWEIKLSDGVHQVEFEHGTTSGKRIIRVDGKEIMRKDWMFKLVGKEHFKLGKAQASCCISIDAVSGFAYEYTIEVNGKSLQKFDQNRSKVQNTWLFTRTGDAGEEPCFRVVLEKDTLDVWVNGQKMQTAYEFGDEGTETHFTLPSGTPAFIRATSSGKRRDGVVHSLIIDDTVIPPAKD